MVRTPVEVSSVHETLSPHVPLYVAAEMGKSESGSITNTMANTKSADIARFVIVAFIFYLLSPFFEKFGLLYHYIIARVEQGVKHFRGICRAKRADLGLFAATVGMTGDTNGGGSFAEPPLCKGRWHGASRDGGIVTNALKQPLSQLR